MPDQPLKILAVTGTHSQNSSTRLVILEIQQRLHSAGCEVDFLDFHKEPLPLFDPEKTYHAPFYASLKSRAEAADVFLLGTPDYHGSMSSAMKNFLDHFWQEFSGKLFATIVASHEKGLTVTDQLRTVARQCYAWSLPYGVSFSDKEDLKDGKISESLNKRITMLVRDIKVYGALLSAQRRHDLTATDEGFMAKYR
jgi:FMN reductase